MSSYTYEDALDKCLAMLQSGTTVEDCLRVFPEFAESLRPQLVTARELIEAQPDAPVRPEAMARGRARLLATLDTERRVRAEEGEPVLGLVAPLHWLSRRWPRVASASRVVAFAAVLGALALAAVGVSATTGQGPVGSLLSPSSGASETEIEGPVTAIDCAGGSIAISSIPIALHPETDFKDVRCTDIIVGDLIKVYAVDQNGGLVAREVERDDDFACEDDETGDDCLKHDATPTAMPTDTRPSDDNSGPGHGDDDDDEVDDGSGPGRGDDDGGEADDNSGPGHDDEGDDQDAVDDDDDRSGPRDGEGGDDDSSGPGSGDNEQNDDDDHGGNDHDDDNSGPGSGDDDD
jgi:hypothetical protein